MRQWNLVGKALRFHVTLSAQDALARRLEGFGDTVNMNGILKVIPAI
jgi:hypothetical protein